MNFRPWLSLTLIGLAFSAPAWSYTSIQAFGDSLTDNGNLYALTSQLIGVGIPISPPYDDGRFSNGPVSVENMATDLGLPLSDHAYGGAQTGTTNLTAAFDGTGIAAQIDTFIAGAGGNSIDSQALYFIWGGANDIFGNVNSTSVATTAASNMANDITTLYNAGARDFFIPNLPDLSLTPWATSGGYTSAALADTLAFNSALATDLQNLSTTLSGAQIQLFDTFDLEHQIIGQLAAQGVNTTTPCISGSYTSPGTVCSNPNQYFYWDDVHPTAAVTRLLGQDFAAAVPEPSTHSLVIASLIFVYVLRRRHATSLIPADTNTRSIEG